MSTSTIRFLVTFGLAVILHSVVVAANNAYCGCQNALPGGTVLANGSITSGDACWSACYNAVNPTPAVAGRTNYRHSMFRASDNTCYCTDKYQYANAQDSGAAGSCAASTDWDNRIVQTTFALDGCYTSAPSGFTFATITGPDSCSIKCANSINFVFFMNSAANTYTCGCGTVGTFPTATTCGPNTYFIYSHSVAQASQGLSRRQRVARELAKQRPQTLCPAGLTACRIPSHAQGMTEAFECVDTSSDIDSCGGCLWGAVNGTDAPDTIGKDCYADGAALGWATCAEGKCISRRCKQGYDLSNGSCVKQHDPRPRLRRGGRGWTHSGF